MKSTGKRLIVEQTKGGFGNVIGRAKGLVQISTRSLVMWIAMAIIVFGSFTGVHAADIEVSLGGEGSDTGEPLSAAVAITDMGGGIFEMSITNTSSVESSTEPGAPVLTRIAFDFANGATLELRDSTLWGYVNKTKPFCGSKRASYPYGISAQKPAPKNGIAQGETATMIIELNLNGEPLSVATFEGVSLAMKFQVVGAGGEDSGCAFGDAEIVSAPLAPVLYKQSEFVASAAEVSEIPSDLLNLDTRAGSLEINTFGSVGYGGEFQDPAYLPGIVSLRNGTGLIVEQKQIERRWPSPLDSEDCNPNTDFYQCWFWSPGALDANNYLVANVPERAVSSNDRFDSVSPRVTVSGDLTGDYNFSSFIDNAHQTITATWDVPVGRVLREETQMLFRGRYDWNCNGLDSPGDAMVPLFYVNGADSNDNLITEGVTIVEDSATRLTITVEVQVALENVRDTYANQGIVLEGSCVSP
jgi:hypothetical protein